MFTKQGTIEKIRNLGLPKVFINLFEDRKLPTNFSLLFGVPEELYRLTKSQQKNLIPSGYEPLWDDGNFDGIYCYVYSDKSLRKVYVEGGEKSYKSFLHFSASVIVNIWELEWENINLGDILANYGTELEFPYVHEVTDFISQNLSTISSTEFEEALSHAMDEFLKSSK